jgi:hypothetical protein
MKNYRPKALYRLPVARGSDPTAGGKGAVARGSGATAAWDRGLITKGGRGAAPRRGTEPAGSDHTGMPTA